MTLAKVKNEVRPGWPGRPGRPELAGRAGLPELDGRIKTHIHLKCPPTETFPQRVNPDFAYIFLRGKKQ